MLLRLDRQQARSVAETRTWVSVSPEGRWVAWQLHPAHVEVEEAATGKRVWQSPEDENSIPTFSPDGRWLLLSGLTARACAVASWAPGPGLGRGHDGAVSPDSRHAILTLPEGVYRLVEMATGRELARLEDPDQTFGAAQFTPDGTRLVVSAPDG